MSYIDSVDIEGMSYSSVDGSLQLDFDYDFSDNGYIQLVKNDRVIAEFEISPPV